VNLALILANIAVFVREVTLPEASSNCFVYTYSFDPAVLTHHALAPASYAAAQCAALGYTLPPAWVTIFTAMFLHASLIHIGGNMLFLFIFGDNVEDKFGHLGYLVFYFICGGVASLAQTLIIPNADLPNLGASGAIAGVLGAYLILFPRARVRGLIFLGIIFFFTTLSAVIFILFWFALQVLDGYVSLNGAGGQVDGGVAYFAHIGGFVAGFVLALVLKPILPKDKPVYSLPNRHGP
jgi:membrane associated rhomboid family serine protease